MVRKWIISLLCPILFSLLLCACMSMTEENSEKEIQTQIVESETPDVMERAAADSDESKVDQAKETATLLYMGQASIRIVTAEGKVIYIDPYAGDDYDLPADLILVTHGHFEHCAVDKVANRDADCAEMVGAKHNIPYHNTTSNTGEMFDRELAGQFDVPNRLVLYPGEELLVE